MFNYLQKAYGIFSFFTKNENQSNNMDRPENDDVKIMNYRFNDEISSVGNNNESVLSIESEKITSHHQAYQRVVNNGQFRNQTDKSEEGFNFYKFTTEREGKTRKRIYAIPKQERNDVGTGFSNLFNMMRESHHVPEPFHWEETDDYYFDSFESDKSKKGKKSRDISRHHSKKRTRFPKDPDCVPAPSPVYVGWDDEVWTDDDWFSVDDGFYDQEYYYTGKKGSKKAHDSK